MNTTSVSDRRHPTVRNSFAIQRSDTHRQEVANYHLPGSQNDSEQEEEESRDKA
jgi:hypothetical protein